jgi:hypothetical protein
MIDTTDYPLPSYEYAPMLTLTWLPIQDALDWRAVLDMYGAIRGLRSRRAASSLSSACDRLLLQITVSAEWTLFFPMS